MNIRSKVSGTLAATALLFGGVIGVMAEDATTTATLIENSAGNSACFASVRADDLDFGEFEWTGDAYEGKMTGEFNLTVTQNRSPLPTDCDFTISGSDLVQASVQENPDFIPAANIELTSNVEPNSTLDPGSPFTVLQVPTGNEGTSFDIGYDLSGAITEQAPDTYTGTLTVTAVGAQPGEETPEDPGV